MLGNAWIRRGESRATLTIRFPQGDKTHILPGSLHLGLRQYYGQRRMPRRGCCRKRASCHRAGPTRVPLSLLASPLHISQQRACPAPKHLSCSVGVLATEGLTPCTHTQLGNQISTWGVRGGGGANFSWPKTLSKPGRPSPSPAGSSAHAQGGGAWGASFPALSSMLCSSRSSHQSRRMLRDGAAASGEPARLVCRQLPAILPCFPRTVSLYGVSIRCAWQAAHSPSQSWGFSTLGFANYLCAGSWESGPLQEGICWSAG